MVIITVTSMGAALTGADRQGLRLLFYNSPGRPNQGPRHPTAKLVATLISTRVQLLL